MALDWKRVVVVAVLVLGAVACGIMHVDQLAFVLAGAAAGAIVPQGTPTAAGAAPLLLAGIGAAAAAVVA